MKKRNGFSGCGDAAGRQDAPVFRASGITKIYRQGTQNEVRALDGIDLELFAGELVVLLGASGSGKSTLLNILGGLDVPTGGRLFFSRPGAYRRRRKSPDPFPERFSGFCIPVLQFNPKSYRPRKCGPCDGDLPGSHGSRGCPEACRPGG